MSPEHPQRTTEKATFHMVLSVTEDTGLDGSAREWGSPDCVPGPRDNLQNILH